MGRPFKVDVEKLKELHGQGLSDYRIAKILGVSTWTVGYSSLPLVTLKSGWSIGVLSLW
jgi:hypothetical protein